MAKAKWLADPAALLKVRTGFELESVNTASTPGISANKAAGGKLLVKNASELGELQERLFAESRFGGARSLLLVLQGMDTAGKGGVIKQIVRGISPEGVTAFGFKKPTDEELAHDFLWRVRKRLPAPGIVGVFDRSQYEDVLIARVRKLATPAVIEERYGQINDFEKQLVASGTTVVKVMLHISADEQRARLQRRLDRVDKHWKYNPGDIDERELWPQYQEAYQLAIEKTSTPDAPWFVIPADHKWYARVAVQRLVIDALLGLKLDWPVVDYDIETEKLRLAAS